MGFKTIHMKHHRQYAHVIRQQIFHWQTYGNNVKSSEIVKAQGDVRWSTETCLSLTAAVFFNCFHRSQGFTFHADDSWRKLTWKTTQDLLLFFLCLAKFKPWKWMDMEHAIVSLEKWHWNIMVAKMVLFMLIIIIIYYYCLILYMFYLLLLQYLFIMCLSFTTIILFIIYYFYFHHLLLLSIFIIQIFSFILISLIICYYYCVLFVFYFYLFILILFIILTSCFCLLLFIAIVMYYQFLLS